jgi:hypothetical protein
MTPDDQTATAGPPMTSAEYNNLIRKMVPIMDQWFDLLSPKQTQRTRDEIARIHAQMRNLYCLMNVTAQAVENVEAMHAEANK